MRGPLELVVHLASGNDDSQFRHTASKNTLLSKVFVEIVHLLRNTGAVKRDPDGTELWGRRIAAYHDIPNPFAIGIQVFTLDWREAAERIGMNIRVKFGRTRDGARELARLANLRTHSSHRRQRGLPLRR